MTKIHIVDLSLRAIIGTNEWERRNKQDIIINISFEYDASAAARSDAIADAVDYKALKKDIITYIESSQCFLLEKLSENILDIIMKDERIIQSKVRVDKPHALRFAKSVAIEASRQKD